MKSTVFLSAMLLVAGVESFIVQPKWTPSLDVALHAERRQMMQTAAAGALAVLLPNTAQASLLDEYGSGDPSRIKETTSLVASASSTRKAESAIEPNLRSNYYYPTNKKRYLPRIKKCNDAIPRAAESIGAGDWEAVAVFADQADNTILPLKLYTSSLTGGGTNVKVSFTKTMNKDADLFEKNQKLLLKAVSKKDTDLATTALQGMATSLQDYRTVAKLTGPDGGGDIPTVDDIRRAACRVQGRRFEQTVIARDERLRQTEPSSTATIATAAK